MRRNCVLVLATFLCATCIANAAPDANYRRPHDDGDLRRWLENMIWYHHYEEAEIEQATGLSASAIRSAATRFQIDKTTKPTRKAQAPLLVLPYPGGRHPRIGFLDGAVDPQRETKASVFTPWDDTSYVVLDVPEAVWSNLGLIYLAHTHVDTVFDKQGVELEKLEWQIGEDGSLRCERRLPNGIVFGSWIRPLATRLQMEMWLTNGTERPLSDLRVQNCAMLKGAKGFEQQTNENKHFWQSYAACGSTDAQRWIIMAWDPIHRPWGNERCPCLHADPKFPDCAPGQTQYLRGWFSFFEGSDLPAELRRIEQTGWRTAPLHQAGD